MGICFSSLSSPASIERPQRHSGSTSTDSKDVGSFPVPLPSPNGQILERPNLKVFSFEDLKSATNNFGGDTLLGLGGFNQLYKGWLDEKTLTPTRTGSGMVVSIRRLNRHKFRQWQSEVNFLGRHSHPNLVKLLGYCWDDEELLLVYEFMPNGSLENHLFKIGNPNREPLSWNTRIKIAIGAARALVFLHTSEKQMVTYSNFKSSNILLDGNYNVKLSNFGLAKLGSTGVGFHVTTGILGKYDYKAPEYVATGKLSVKSDVFGFGVVLLEMLTRMRMLDPMRPTKLSNLVDSLNPPLSIKNKLKTIMDTNIEGQYSQEAAFQALQLSLKCIELDPKQRPSLSSMIR